MRPATSAVATILMLNFSSATSSVTPAPLLRLRGGGSIIRRPGLSNTVTTLAEVTVNEERWSFGDSSIKLIPSWSGDVADFGIGALIGVAGGVVAGRWLRWVYKTCTESIAGVPVFAFSHVMFLVVVNMALVRAKIITINYVRLGTSPTVLGKIKPLARRIDRDGDGYLTWKDLELLLSKVLGNKIGKWLTNFLQQTGFDQDGDGMFTHKDVMLILAGNQHGALGLQVGALAGVLVGSLAPLLPTHRVATWSARVAKQTALTAACTGKKVCGRAFEAVKHAWCWCWV